MILSASRRTDIPNYYSDWFYERIKEGYLYVRNPINIHQISKIDLSPEVVDCIVFWTKNPINMIQRLNELDNYKYYFQFTITGYGHEIEPNIPAKRENIIPAFMELSKKIGKDKIIWRYDPIYVNLRYTTDYHINAFRQLAETLSPYTNKVVISFIDLYLKTKKNTKGLDIKEPTHDYINTLALEFSKIGKQNNLVIETCAELMNLDQYGIFHGSCISKSTIENVIGCKIKCKKDKNQRQECGCVESIDVGAYNSCKNNCKYCYANYDNKSVALNSALYDVHSPILCSTITELDRITERKVKSLKETQLSVFDIL